MALTLTLGGTTKVISEGSLVITEVANGANRLTARVVSGDGSYAPAGGSVVVASDAVETLFGGKLAAPGIAGLGGVGLPPTEVAIDADDYNVYAKQRTFTGTIPAGTTKALLTALLPYFPASVTLWGSQPDGPTLPELAYPDPVTLETILNQVAGVTDWVWDLSYAEVLSMTEPGTVAAPFDVIDGDGHVEGDIAVTQDDSTYANRLIGKFGSADVAVDSEACLGDGSRRSWLLKSPVRSFAAAVHITDTGVDVWRYMGTYDDAPFEWTLAINPTTLAATVHQKAWGDVLSAAGRIAVTYVAALPFMLTVNDLVEQAGPRGIVERASIFEVPDCIQWATAQAMLDAELVRSVAVPKKVVYPTYERGAHPGMTQHIQALARGGVHGDYLITEVALRDKGPLILSTVTATEGAKFRGSNRDKWKALGGGASSTMIAGSGGGGSVTPILFGLGGSRTSSVTADTATPVLNFLTFTCPVTGSYLVLVEAWGRDPGVGITASLYNVTDSAALTPTSAKVVTPNPPAAQETTFLVDLVIGKKYRLDVVSDAAGASVYAIGQLRSA